jgi:hypothetical protein
MPVETCGPRAKQNGARSLMVYTSAKLFLGIMGSSIERWRLAAALDSARKLVMEAILETQAFYWLKRVTDIDVSKTQSRLSRS